MSFLRPQKAFLRVTEIKSFVDAGNNKSIITMLDGKTYHAQNRAGVLFEEKVDEAKDMPQPWDEWAEIFLVPSIRYRVAERICRAFSRKP